MGKHLLMVFTNPTEGEEGEHNTWYDDTHLGEVLAVDGITKAQRFAVADVVPGVTDHRYVAIHEFDTEDPQGVMYGLDAALPTMHERRHRHQEGPDESGLGRVGRADVGLDRAEGL